MEAAQIFDIIKNNPNKELVKFGHEMNERLEKCIIGENLDAFFKRNTYFENKEIFEERKKTTSNKDLFARLLQKEHMVFTARGGSAIYEGLTEEQTKELNAYLDEVRDGTNLRTWIQQFANKAYEVDPMAIIFIEKDTEGNPYPTYKSIKTIYDYSINGQSLNYICFSLCEEEAKTYAKKYKFEYKPELKYYRFVDEKSDYLIAKKTDINIQIIENATLVHGWTSCPAILISDIPYYKKHSCKLSKLDNVIELAEAYQNDRSIRDLSKLFAGYPKLVEPQTKCPECVEGYIGGVICPTCNGTGNKNGVSKVSDSIKIPLEMLAENPSLDISKIFLYITPDIETWNKQDNSLSDLENQISDCFWGTDNRKFTGGANLQSNLQETATKTMTNLQPVYSRLERTAEWGESIEKIIIYCYS